MGCITPFGEASYLVASDANGRQNFEVINIDCG